MPKRFLVKGYVAGLPEMVEIDDDTYFTKDIVVEALREDVECMSAVFSIAERFAVNFLCIVESDEMLQQLHEKWRNSLDSWAKRAVTFSTEWFPVASKSVAHFCNR